MSYGLSIKNDLSYVQIDSESPRLCAVYSGTYAASSYIVYVTFPSPITTQEPPCIFIRNSPARQGELYTDMTISGSPGAWSGFRITSLNINDRPTGKWFAAVFAARADAQYGLRMWDGSNNVIYDSGTVPVIFTRANHNWAYAGMVVINPTAQGYYWKNSSVSPMLEDEYFMINPFSRGILISHTNWMPCGVRFNYSENCLQMYGVSALSPWINIGQYGAVFARLPGT